ncbi:hypothetical protein MNBD_GAMMA12-3221 [hydrothermal vent metagenome]|uniref:Helix-turn-helix type 11 domain-containing protein n=1 Tax=hydrothermal vent metagenome TaxID=652676 RepID=A0A3B0YPX9_9ZZZZ
MNIQTSLDELGVSRATFNRDFKYLRERLNRPIQYDRYENINRLDNVDEEFDLLGIRISASEASALLSLVKFIDPLESGVLYNAIQLFQQQLINQLTDGNLNINDVLKRIRMNARQVEPPLFWVDFLR